MLELRHPRSEPDLLLFCRVELDFVRIDLGLLHAKLLDLLSGSAAPMT
jgi:hypothetical protein